MVSVVYEKYLIISKGKGQMLKIMKRMQRKCVNLLYMILNTILLLVALVLYFHPKYISKFSTSSFISLFLINLSLRKLKCNKLYIFLKRK